MVERSKDLNQNLFQTTSKRLSCYNGFLYHILNCDMNITYWIPAHTQFAHWCLVKKFVIPPEVLAP